MVPPTIICKDSPGAKDATIPFSTAMGFLPWQQYQVPSLLLSAFRPGALQSSPFPWAGLCFPFQTVASQPGGDLRHESRKHKLPYASKIQQCKLVRTVW